MTADRIDDEFETAVRIDRSGLIESPAPVEASVGLFGQWWADLEPHERVLYRGLLLLAAGLALVALPLALIVPGAVLTGLAVAAALAAMRAS
jgi:hypothetical protein